MATVRRGGPRVENAVSAGGVVVRIGEQGIEIVICGRNSDGVWGLPKGTPNPGETMEETALREVSEETGLEVSIVRLLGVSDHRFLLPCAVLLGGSLLTLSDTVARTVMAPQQLPVGVITALIGVPMYLFILNRGGVNR